MKFNPRRAVRVAKRPLPFALAVSAALFAAGAWADTPGNKQDAAEGVTVDFSVLGDGAPGSLGAPLPGSGGRRLLMPGIKSPRSQLHVSPVGPSRPARPPKTAPGPKVAAAPLPAKAAPAPPPPPKAAPVPKVEAAPPPPPPKAEKPPASLAIVPEQEGIATVAIETPAPEPPKTEPEKTQPEKTVASEPPAPPPALTPPESPKESETAAAPPGKVTEKAPEPAPAPPPPPSAEPAAGTEKPAEPAPAEKAALTPPPLEPGRAMRVEFDATQSKVPVDVKPRLEELAAGLKGRPGLRVQILAYAGGDDLSAGKARRLSLSRALSVRSFLIEKEIRSTRIDVRALGNKTTEKPLNRVDINITER